MYSINKLSELLDVDRRTLKKRIEKGKLKPVSKNGKSKLYDLESVREVVEQEAENSRSEKYRLECQKLAKQIESLELKNKKELGMYCETEEVKQHWLKHISQARNILVSIPETAPQLCGKTAAQIEKELSSQIDKVIEKLREGSNES